MKALSLTLFFAFIYNFGFAQKEKVFRIDSLPKQGILLDKNWKWHAGDNPEWAKVDFDDSKWERIDPTKDIFELPQLDQENGQIDWFRLRFVLDSALNSQQLVAQIRQSGASEVYLNGQLILRFGVLSTNRSAIEAFTPNGSPVSFPASTGHEQVLAVRFALQPGIRYGQHFGTLNSAFTLRLNTTEAATVNYRNRMLNTSERQLYVSAFGILAVLFLSFFLFSSTRKEALYFAIYCCLVALTWSWFNKNSLPIPVKNIFTNNNTFLIVQTIGYVFLPLSVYAIFRQKPRWAFSGLVVYALASIYCGTFVYGWGWQLYGIGMVWFACLDATRVAYLAVRQGQSGAWIILVGGILYMVCWALFQLDFLGIFKFDTGNNFFIMAYLLMPVSFAIYYGYDFGMTNRALRQKLAEVETLSVEKQQILATQNETLEKQVAERTAELKASQNQLIQKEKLASLGELTAGIAHEIQNPLNFVNNFSEMSIELIEELKSPLTPKGGIEEEELLSDITQNLQKINLHGKRASSIVKGMLEHSRTSTGVKELTDINKLADEYLRLSYHGIRAKDSSFNSDYQTAFDENLPKIEVIPQDMGRVLLNLINNAFWAVKTIEKPLVTVKTEHLDNQILIKVSDNGIGMTDEVKAKIFQPFFTTKPTGQGTGLGLSLAYDIVTKGHGGTIGVESTEGIGSEFTITLHV